MADLVVVVLPQMLLELAILHRPLHLKEIMVGLLQAVLLVVAVEALEKLVVPGIHQTEVKVEMDLRQLLLAHQHFILVAAEVVVMVLVWVAQAAAAMEE